MGAWPPTGWPTPKKVSEPMSRNVVVPEAMSRALTAVPDAGLTPAERGEHKTAGSGSWYFSAFFFFYWVLVGGLYMVRVRARAARLRASGKSNSEAIVETKKRKQSGATWKKRFLLGIIMLFMVRGGFSYCVSACAVPSPPLLFCGGTGGPPSHRAPRPPSWSLSMKLLTSD